MRGDYKIKLTDNSKHTEKANLWLWIHLNLAKVQRAGLNSAVPYMMSSHSRSFLILYIYLHFYKSK